MRSSAAENAVARRQGTRAKDDFSTASLCVSWRMMTATEFDADFRMLCDEIYRATLSWHAYLSLNAEINASESLLDALNEHPSFWRITISALQHNSILTLGRIFDKDPRSHSIRRLVKACVEHPGIFSRHALRNRRIKDEKAGWFEEYIAKAFVPDATHLKQLEKELNACAAIWDAAYEPIRHKVVAHRDRLSQKEVAGLFAKTKVREMTDLLQRLYTIREAIWELSMNAKPLDFSRKNNPWAAEVEQSTRGMLQSLLRAQRA